MTTETTTDISNWYSNSLEYEINQTVRFWLFLISDIFAFVCTIFVLYHLLTDRNLRSALQNHALITILFFALTYEVIDIPLQLQYLCTGSVRPAIPFTCLLWWFVDWGCYYTIAVLVAFASMERHILIFHTQLVGTRRRRWVFHYLPLLTITSFMMIFYIVAIFVPICESTFDYTSNLCGVHACYGTIRFFVIVEQLGFSTTSSCLIVVFNMTLLARVIRQKYRIHRAVQWRRQRKLAVQTIALSLLYLIFSLPLAIIYLVRLFGSSDWADEYVTIFFFFSYYAVLLFPFVSLGNIPDLWKKLKKCNARQPRRIAAVTLRS